MQKRRILRILIVLTLVAAVQFFRAAPVFSQETPAIPNIPNVNLSITQPQTGSETAFAVQVLLLVTIFTLAPSILILLTCFLRLTISLDFVKRALSLQQVPSTAVMNGIAFFMTIFIMWPTFSDIYERSFKPMSQNEITLDTAIDEAISPLRVFMYKQMDKDPRYIELFMSMGRMERPNNLNDVPTHVLIPAYILHELTAAFKIGILIYVPFIVIDIVVAAILLSLGMMMMPAAQVSMPFKLILFVLVDGWGLLTQQFYASFNL